MAIGLNDYTFRLSDTGVTLNTDGTLPFVDIEKVTGLDNAPYRETQRDHEGTDGGFLDAEFERGRDVILDGIIYANTSNVETYLDSLKANFAPVQSPIPFYLKAPGINERVVFVKPRGVRYDWETARRLGITTAQFLMYAEDPRIYDSTLQSSDITYGGAAGNGFGFVSFLDTYTRSTSNGFGISDSGHTYTLTGTAADFSTDGALARISLTAATTTIYWATINTLTAVNHWLYAQGLSLSAAPTGGTISQLFAVRMVDTSNYYFVEIIRTTTNTCQVALVKVVGGVFTTIVSAVTVGTLTATQAVDVRVEITQGQGSATGSYLRAKVWASGTAEPVAQTIESAIESSITATGGFRVGAVRNSGNTNVNPVSKLEGLQWAQGFGFNLDFGGGATPAGTNVTNAGNRPTPAIFTIHGPVDNPLIANDTTGGILNFVISLSGSDTLTVDLLNRTVLLNGAANRRSTLTTNGWFLLNPGVNFIRYGGANGGGSSMNIAFRSAWR